MKLDAMKLDAMKLAAAAAMTTAVIWTVCAALVALLPGNMMNLSGHMVHADLAAMNWTLTWVGYFVGLVIWSFSAAVTGWLIATFYNWKLG